MPNFLDEEFVKQQESSPSILTFVGNLSLCFIESIGLLMLFIWPLGYLYFHLLEPYCSPFLAKTIGTIVLVSSILFGILVPIHTLFKRGNWIVFKDSLLRMNFISIGLWSFPCLLVGLSIYNFLISLILLAWLSIGFFLTSLQFKYPTQRMIPFSFILYWFLSILFCLWYSN